SLRPWFEERGYFLNHHKYGVDRYGDRFPQYVYPHFPADPSDELPQLPYSQFGGDGTFHISEKKVLLLAHARQHQIIYAQDSQRRHVAMKLVKEGSIEYNVYQRLSQEESLFTADPQTFGCVIPPLDFIELYDGLSFIVMPRSRA
ncbi:hypothetical protein BU15DRAFT_34256, partial [Melanogaster broomeanus]